MRAILKTGTDMAAATAAEDMAGMIILTYITAKTAEKQLMTGSLSMVRKASGQNKRNNMIRADKKVRAIKAVRMCRAIGT